MVYSEAAVEDGLHSKILMDMLNADRKGKLTYNDVTIVVKGTEFPCHRCILAAYSGYFKTIFESDFSERYSRKIQLTGPLDDEITQMTFNIVLDFCYGKKSIVTSENVYDVTLASDYLQVDNLKMQCVDFMRTSLGPNNWLKIYRCAVKLNQKSLIKSCLQNFAAVSNCIDFKNFLFEEFFSVVKHLKTELKSAKLFQTILSWVKETDETDQHYFFEKLMELVDFNSMNVGYLQKTVLQENLAISSIPILQKLTHVLANRLQHNEASILIAGGDGKSSTSFEKYYPSTKTFSKCNSSPKPCDSAAVAVQDGYLYVAGGKCNEANIQIYDVNDDHWVCEEGVLRTSRTEAAAAVINGKLYIVGGMNNFFQRLSSTESFQINGTACSPQSRDSVPKLKHARSFHSAVARKDSIYVIGGFDGDFRLNSCESLNVVSRERRDIASLHKARNALAAVLFEDHIVAIGGFDGKDSLSAVESYSFAFNQWTVTRSMMIARSALCACVLDNKIYVVGGHRSNTIEVYDPRLLSWKLFENLVHSRARSSVVEI